MARHRNSGLGFVGIVVVFAVVYFSGAGSWLWQRVERLGGDCYTMASSSQIPKASVLCEGAGAVIAWVGELPNTFRQGIDTLKVRFGIAADLPDVAGLKATVNQRLLELGSSGSAFKERLQQGPAQLWEGNIESQLRPAIDHYRIGVQYLQQGAPQKAVNWLQSGANAQGGYGLMSQLQLGDLYSHGASGIAPDPIKAHYYYGQAKASLQQLKENGAPQAQQMLKSLPLSVSELETRLNR